MMIKYFVFIFLVSAFSCQHTIKNNRHLIKTIRHKISSKIEVKLRFNYNEIKTKKVIKLVYNFYKDERVLQPAGVDLSTIRAWIPMITNQTCSYFVNETNKNCVCSNCNEICPSLDAEKAKLNQDRLVLETKQKKLDRESEEFETKKRKLAEDSLQLKEKQNMIEKRFLDFMYILFDAEKISYRVLAKLSIYKRRVYTNQRDLPKRRNLFLRHFARMLAEDSRQIKTEPNKTETECSKLKNYNQLPHELGQLKIYLEEYILQLSRLRHEAFQQSIN